MAAPSSFRGSMRLSSQALTARSASASYCPRSSSSSRLASTSTQSSGTQEASPVQSSPSSPPPQTPINVSLLLSRQPVILREQHPFETSYFHYNSQLSHRLAQPFSKDFYFRKGSAAETRFDREEEERAQMLAAGASGKKSAPSAAKPAAQEAQSRDPDAALYATTERRTKADESRDTSSLERALDRSLFLVLKEQSTGQWRLPQKRLDFSKGETLHKVAPNPVQEALGEGMDLWLVSKLPIGLMRGTEEKVRQSCSVML